MNCFERLREYSQENTKTRNAPRNNDSRTQRTSLVLFVVFATSIAPLLAQSSQLPAPSTRPRIGLVLSGGGARGFAHVGVIKALEEMGIPIDYIAGTSMGAMVGSLYASGMSSEQLEDALLSINWPTMFNDKAIRRDRAFHRKKQAQRYLFDYEIGIRGTKFLTPTGLRGGQRLIFALREHLLPVAHINDFNQLPIPFNCVATDIELGDWVVLKQGDLVKAVRASMSLPGLLSPVVYDGRLLIDGGIFRNLPIDVARSMGADIVIAVDISAPLLQRNQLKSPMSITNQAMGASLRKEVDKQHALADILLIPDLAGVGTLEYTQLEKIIQTGRDVAVRNRAKLLPYASTKQAPAKQAYQPPQIVFIRVEGLQRVSERIVRKQINLHEGQFLDIVQLGRDLSRIYGLGDFELVDFRLEPQETGTGLVIMVREKHWGPNYIQSGLELFFDDDQNTIFQPEVNLTKTRLNSLGLEWSTDLVIGEEHAFETSLYQPLDYAGRFFLEGRYGFLRDLQNIFLDGSKAQLEGTSHTLNLSAGLNMGAYAEFRASLLQGVIDRSLKSGELDSFSERIDFGGLVLAFSLDRLDSITFPRKGALTVATLYSSRPGLNADDRFDRLFFEQVLAKSWGKHTFLSWGEGGMEVDSVLPPAFQFSIGGFSSFTGYEVGELTGSRYAIYRPTYLYQLGRLSPVIGRGYYIGGWLEAGNIWQDSEDIALDNLRFAATLVLAADTVLGPVYLGLGFAEKNRHGIYLAVGPSF